MRTNEYLNGARSANRKRHGARDQRITRIANKLADRAASRPKLTKNGFVKSRVLSRKTAKMRTQEYIAYDLETSNIKAGDPEVKYLTAYCDDEKISQEIFSLEHLGDVLRQRFLTPERNRARYVAWNGNRFDVYFIARALMHHEDLVIRPYLSSKKSLRGLRISEADPTGKLTPKEIRSWEFLDGMAMTGIQRPLKDFLKIFAPDYEKKELDFSVESFDPSNPQHVEYAERDSEGLYHAIKKANVILRDNFDAELTPTIGGLGIKIFQSHIPENVVIFSPPPIVEKIIVRNVMRGGYCHCAKKYNGKTWKYDLNQAYAAAMRDAKLPTGRCIQTQKYNQYARAAIYQVTATNPKNIIPFYAKNVNGDAVFETTKLEKVWIVQAELQQLQSEKWNIEIHDGYFWDDSFSMKNYVDKLENLRINGEGGTKGALGEIVKAVGNNSYGKTLEKLNGLDLLMSHEQPEGYSEFFDVEQNGTNFIWFKIGDPISKPYHQPQIGAFITAHVRMVVRRAIMLAPGDWLYADTDCVAFTRPVNLTIDAGIYGAWKREANGDVYRFIDKKVYSTADGKEKKAKGMNIKNLTLDDFDRWFNGSPPIQNQIHRESFLKVMKGAPMFHEQKRTGTKSRTVYN